METKDIPRGDKIMIRPAIVLDRKELSPADLAEIQDKRCLNCGDAPLFELEAQGLTIARGKLIKRMGKHYFKIIETAGGNE
jgi:hypothetical protein